MHDGFVNNSIKTTFRFSIKKKMEEKIRKKTTIKEISTRSWHSRISVCLCLVLPDKDGIVTGGYGNHKASNISIYNKNDYHVFLQSSF